LLAWLDAYVADYYLPPPLAIAADVDAADPSGLSVEDAALFAKLRSGRTWIRDA
jgi:hypothetical protein